MESNKIDIFFLLKGIWDKRTRVYKSLVAGAILGGIVAFSMPKEYESKVILVPENTKNEGGLSGSIGALAGIAGISTGSSYAEGLKTEIYPDIVKSTPFVTEFANMIIIPENGDSILLHEYLNKTKIPWWTYLSKLPKKSIYLILELFVNNESIDDQPREGDSLIFDRHKPDYYQLGFVRAFNSRVYLDFDKKSKFLTVSVTMQDPSVSTQISDAVVLKLQDYMTRYNTLKAREDLALTEKLYNESKTNYLAAEYAYAEIVDKNVNLISKRAEVKLEKYKNERDVALSVYSQLASNLESAKLKVQEDTSIASIIEPSIVPLTPRSPQKLKIILVFSVLAMLISIVITTFQVQFSKTMTNE